MSLRLSASQIRILVQAIPLAYFLKYSFEPQYLIGSVIFYILICRLGIDLGFHRFFAHGAFDASIYLKRLLLILGTLSARGSVLAWVAVHEEHHEHADTSLDPHPGIKSSFIGLWFAGIKPISGKLSFKRKLLKDPWILFIHRNYSSILIAFVITLGLISFKGLVYFYCLPIIYLSLSNFLTNTVCHNWGYRNFQTPDQSTNNLWVQYITLGGGLHNNHHAMPYALTQRVRWYEIDPLEPIIKILLVIDRPFAKSAPAELKKSDSLLA